MSVVNYVELLNSQRGKWKLEDMNDSFITNLFVSMDHRELVFVTSSGRVWLWYAEGDCCSESWFSDIDGVSALRGHRIFKAESVPLNSYNTEDGRTRQEYDRAYGYRIETTGGYVDIVFRNSSNGFYGGWMYLFSLDWVPDGMVEILDDWKA